MTRRFLAGLGAACALLATAGTPPPSMPHPPPLSRTKSADNAQCVKCHSAIGAEWDASLHHVSFTDKDFQHSLPSEGGDPFCKNCHAPEKDEKLGVACVTCHVTSADVLAAPGTSTAPHALTRTADFATDAACRACHEFDFPDSKNRIKPLAMQRTVSEHAGRTDTCLSCHMKKKDGHVEHGFSAARNSEFVKSAVKVSAMRVGGNVEVTLSPAHVGHAFPTGDLFRRIRVSVGKKEKFLSRHFMSREELPGKLVRTEIGDDRVQGGDRVVSLEAPSDSVHVRVVYERAEGPNPKTPIFGSIELFAADL